MFDKGVRLTAHFWSGEFQCKCGCGFGLAPGEMDMAVVEGLERLRAKVGRPLYVVWWNAQTRRFQVAGSGCRCETHNASIKGASPRSLHRAGRAADVWGAPVADIVACAKEIPVFRDGGIGRYDRRHFVHLDNGPRRRW